MMPRKIAVLALAGLLSVGAAAAFADAMSPESAVAARQAAMKEDGKVLRGASNLTGDKAVAVLTTVHKNYTELPSLFPKDSVTDKSIAKPIIWEQFDQFSAIFKKGADAAAAGIAAAKAGDTAKYKEAVEAVASTCNECHQTYRTKES